MQSVRIIVGLLGMVSVGSVCVLAQGDSSRMPAPNKRIVIGASTLLDVLDARKVLSDAQELTVNAELRRDLAQWPRR